MLDTTTIIKLYTQENKSTKEIAEQLNTYPNKILRILKKAGVTLRTRSDAQKLALAEGKSPHPTKGTKRPADTKLKISEKISENWKNLSDDERRRRADVSRENWMNMTDEQKADLGRAAGQSIRKAAKEGSRLERYLMTELI